MEQEIKYTRSFDGNKIGFAIAGKGPAIVRTADIKALNVQIGARVIDKADSIEI